MNLCGLKIQKQKIVYDLQKKNILKWLLAIILIWISEFFYILKKI